MFVTFEGLDGSGKSTQAELLRARLEADGVDVVSTREPGGTELGEGVRNLVLHGGHVGPWAEALLYVAARAQLVDEVIRPALDRGASVICDRYVDSSVAYQGAGRELGVDRILDLNLAAVGGLLPDRTFLLELDPARSRRASSGTSTASSAKETTSVRGRHEGYRELAARFPGADRSCSTRRGPPTSSPRRCMEPFASVPEQPEAKRLLAAALSDGGAQAYLLHGPAGVGKRTAAFAFAVRRARRRAARRGALASRPLPPAAARGDDPHRRHQGAPPRPAHAAVRGRPARLSRPRRRPDERGGGRRAAQGSRGAAAVRGHRPRRGRAGAAAADDPLALPAHSVHAALRSGGAGVDRRPRRRSEARRRSHVLARASGGRLDRARRLLDPDAAARRDELIATARAVYRDGLEPGDAAGVLLDVAAARAEEAREQEQAVVDTLDLPARDAEQRVKRAQRGAERDELLAALEGLEAWYRDLVVVAAGADEAVVHADRLDELREDVDVGRRRRRRRGRRVGARDLARARGVQPQSARSRSRRCSSGCGARSHRPAHVLSAPDRGYTQPASPT